MSDVHGTKTELPVLLGIWLGMRRSEICGLTWQDVDFSSRTITIQHALIQNSKKEWILQDRTKTEDSTRINRIPDYINYILSNMEQGNADERIIDMMPDAITHRFAVVCRRLNVKNCHFHNSRRSMATIGLTKLNIADKIIMSRGGWSSPKIMKDVYQVALSDDEATANKMFDEYFEKLLPNI